MLLSLTLSSAAAPAPEPPKEKGPREPMLEEKFVDHLQESLELKAEQRVKIKAIIDHAKPELEKLHKEELALREKKRQALRAVREDIRAVLDIEQKERFDELSVRLRRRLGRRRAGPGMMGPGMRPGAGPEPEGGRPQGGPGPGRGPDGGAPPDDDGPDADEE